MGARGAHPYFQAFFRKQFLTSLPHVDMAFRGDQPSLMSAIVVRSPVKRRAVSSCLEPAMLCGAHKVRGVLNIQAAARSVIYR